MADRIKVLFLAADPLGAGSRLLLGEEASAIGRAIDSGSARGAFDFHFEWIPRTADLRRALVKHRPSILHFSGHGGRDGSIRLGDEYGAPMAVDRAALSGLIDLFGNIIHVVVLNACNSQRSIESFSGTAPYTVGMESAVRDTAAIVFAEAFYSSLAEGETVSRAFRLAVGQLHMDGMDGKIPTLTVRPGVDIEVPLVHRLDESAPVALSAPPPSPTTPPGMLNSIGCIKSDDVSFSHDPRTGAALSGMVNEVERIDAKRTRFETRSTHDRRRGR
jgi:hypothetical protein